MEAPAKARFWRGLQARVLGLQLGVFLLATGGAFLLFDRLSQEFLRQELRQRLQQAGSEAAEVLATPLWNLDYAYLEHLLKTWAANPDFLSAQVFDEGGGLLAQSGLPEAENPGDLLLDAPVVMRLAGNEPRSIGRLVLRFRDHAVTRQIAEQRKLFLGMLFLLSAASVLATLLAHRRAVNLPLRLLLATIHEARRSGKRPSVAWRSGDELGEVIAAFNALQQDAAHAEAALRASEAKYRTIFEHSQEGLIQTRADGTVLTANPAAAALMGYADVEALVRDGKAVGRRLLPRWEDREQFRRSMLSAGEVRDLALCLDDGRGGERHLILNARTVSGEAPYFEGSLHDISAHKRAEALDRANQAARAASEAKSAFLAHMSHDIRTPMNAIIGFTELLLRSEQEPRQLDYLRKIAAASHTLLQIINDILDVSKIEAGKLELEQVDFDLGQLVERIIDLFGQRATEKGLEFVAYLADTVPHRLVGDPLRLEQVLTNLVSNALKFTEQGNVVLNVTPRSLDAERVRLHFGVMDTGLGIAAETLPQLFQAFTQADGSTTRRFGGTGLGLTICKHLVERMGGSLTARSEPGAGSLFEFELELPRAAPGAEPRYFPAELKDLEVLVVDDNENARICLAEILHSLHFRVLCLDSGQAALEALEREPRRFGLVLLDWKMPGMDGLATAEALRLRGYSAKRPVIMMTAFGQEELRREAKALGLAACLSKPIKASDLLDAMVSVCGPRLPAATARIPGPASRLRGRVLLVEDNAFNQEIAKELLLGLGLEVDIAPDGAQGRDRTLAGGYDLVLMDMQMPVMDGLEATRAIRAAEGERHTPIVAMTANALKGDRERCLEAGMDDYLSKPIEPERLAACLAAWLKGGDRAAPAQALAMADQPPMAWNSAAGLARVNGKTQLYARLLRDFVQEYRDAAQGLAQRQAAGEWEAALQLAHALKGVAGNLGAEAVQAAAQAVELALAARKDYAFKEALAQLSQALDAACSQLPLSPEPTEAPSVEPLDEAELYRELERLCALLTARDLGAERLFAALEASLRAHGHAEAATSVERRMAAFDYAGARLILGELVLGEGRGGDRIIQGNLRDGGGRNA
ncbi:MAG: response regulator [Gammaproteobacteria bacterium]|nr:response regulator [Gammaproteobacteria bacterium]